MQATAERVQRFMQILSLGICVFILLDAYIIPFTNSREVVNDHFKTAHAIGSGKIYSYKIFTEKRELVVDGETYQKVLLMDTITIKQSMITRSLQQIVLEKDGAVYIWHIGFLSFDGIVFVVLLAVGIVFFMIFFNKMRYPKGRNGVGVYLLLLSVALLVLHIFL